MEARGLGEIAVAGAPAPPARARPAPPLAPGQPADHYQRSPVAAGALPLIPLDIPDPPAAAPRRAEAPAPPGRQVAPGVWYADPAALAGRLRRAGVVVSGPVRAVVADPVLADVRPVFTDGDRRLSPGYARGRAGLAAAINGTYFAYSGGTIGDLKGDGRTALARDGRLGRWAPGFGERRYSLGTDEAGRVRFVYGSLAGNGGPGAWRSFMGGLGVLYGPQGPPPAGYKPPPLPADRPHALAGVDAHGRLILATVGTGDGYDGTGGGSPRQLAALMRALGAVEAYYLDGGGSTNLIVPGAGLAGTSNRPVTSYLGVFRR